MFNKTHYSSLSTESSQWTYKLDSIGKYQPTLNIMRKNNRQKARRSNQVLNTIHHDYLRSKLSQVHLSNTQRRLFKTSPELTTFSSKDLNNYNIPFTETFNSSISNALTYRHDPTHKRESSSQFLQKTHAMIECMMIKGFQEEKLREVNERTASKLQAINTQVYQLNESSKLFNFFTKSQKHYIKYLYTKIDEEKKANSALYEYRRDLEGSIHQMNIKIHKAKQIIQSNKQYKIFLLLIKYEVKSLEQLPLQVLIQYGLFQGKQRESISKKNNNLIQNLLIHKGNIKSDLDTNSHLKRHLPRNSIFLKEAKATQETGMGVTRPLLINPPIFNSPEESIEHFGQIEERLTKLYRLFNDKIYELQCLSRERDNNKQLINKHDIEDQKIIEALSIEVKKLKGRHEMLSEDCLKEKETLDKIPSVDVLFRKIKKTLLSLPFDIEKTFSMPLFYLHINEKSPLIYILGKRESQALYAIKTLETVLLHLLQLMKEYKSNIKLSHELRKVVFVLEKNKRYEKSRQNKLFEMNRRERINKEIIEKYNKVLFLSKRKTQSKIKIRQKRRNTLIKHEQANEFDIEALLTY